VSATVGDLACPAHVLPRVCVLLVGLAVLSISQHAVADPATTCTWDVSAASVRRHGDRTEEAETTVCFVDTKRVTTRAVPLGTATCGLARPVPCAWDLAAQTSTLIAFTGLRGGIKLVDRRRQRVVAFEAPVDYQFPPDLAVCGRSICISGVLADETAVYGRLVLGTDRVTYQRLRPRR
jgi:hypothetical protein